MMKQGTGKGRVSTNRGRERRKSKRKTILQNTMRRNRRQKKVKQETVKERDSTNRERERRKSKRKTIIIEQYRREQETEW